MSGATAGQLLIFEVSASADLGHRITQHLGVALANFEEHAFEDGEFKIRPLVNVRNRDRNRHRGSQHGRTTGLSGAPGDCERRGYLFAEAIRRCHSGGSITELLSVDDRASG